MLESGLLKTFLEVVSMSRDVASFLETYATPEMQAYAAALADDQAKRGHDHLLQAKRRPPGNERLQNLGHAAERFTDAARNYLQSCKRSRYQRSSRQLAESAVRCYSLAAKCHLLLRDDVLADARLVDLCHAFFGPYLAAIENEELGERSAPVGSHHEEEARKEFENRRNRLKMVAAEEHTIMMFARRAGKLGWTPLCHFTADTSTYTKMDGRWSGHEERLFRVARRATEPPKWMHLIQVGKAPEDLTYAVLVGGCTGIFTFARLAMPPWAREQDVGLALVRGIVAGFVAGCLSAGVVSAAVEALGFPWLPDRLEPRVHEFARAIAILAGIAMSCLVVEGLIRKLSP